MHRPELAPTDSIDPIEEPSMRRLEYAICAIAALAVVLLGFLR